MALDKQVRFALSLEGYKPDYVLGMIVGFDLLANYIQQNRDKK